MEFKFRSSYLALRFQGKSGIEQADSQSVHEHVPVCINDIQIKFIVL